jgi:signal transduction histidine kinase
MFIEEEIENNIIIQSILNSLSEMIFIFDDSRKIKYVNNAVKEFINKNRDKIVIDATHGDILNCSFFLKDKGCGYGPFCSSCFIRESIEKVLKTEEQLKDREGIITLRRNGEEKKIYIVISAVPLKLNNKKYVVLTMRDITKIKEYEMEKIRELEKLSIIGSSAASIVHDLKNPITGISGYIYILEKESKKEENRHIFSKINGSLKRVHNMIEEILNIASGKEKIDITLEEIVYENFMDDFFKEIRVNSKIQKNVNFKNTLKIDSNKITQVLWNIIKNADEANIGINGVITIEIYQENEKVITKISDNGKGIPEDIRGKIFNAGNSFGKKGGKGFGLFSVKKIIEAHGGEIYFKSEVGKGSEFYIILPI